MDSTEKRMIMGAVIVAVVSLFALFGSIYIINRTIVDAGGLKGIAVSIGRDIKDIKKQIDNE